MTVVNTNLIPTRLTELQVNEVSLVSKGAIGEVFTIMKSGEETDIVKAGDVLPMLQAMSDTQFISVMQDMMGRYQQINKDEGGQTMDENQVKEMVTTLVAEVIGKSMETVNSNFSKINKSIDEITKKVSEQSAMSEEEKAAMEKKKKEMMGADSEVKKAIGDIGDAVKSLAETITVIGKSVEGITQIGETVKKMSEEILPGIATRVEKMESQEQPPNGVGAGSGVGTTPVQKSASKWPSFVTPVAE